MVVVMVVVAAVEVFVTVSVSSSLHLIVQGSHYYTFLLLMIRPKKCRGLKEVVDDRMIQCQHIHLPYPYQYAVPFVPSEAPEKTREHGQQNSCSSAVMFLAI